VIGILSIIDAAGREFSAEEIQLVQAFASQSATALRNARLYQEAQETYRQLTRAQEQFVQAQKMEAVGRLAGGVAHDFNNLLTIIMGRIQLQLMRLPAAHPMRRDLELMQSTAERAATLTRQLLAFSRQQILQPQVLDLNALVHEISQLLRRLIGEDIAFVTVLDPTLGQVRADPGQLGQVLFNLALNARDAMPRGGQLTVETTNVVQEEDEREDPRIPPGQYVQLRVSDTGVGMDTAVQAHLFEPFFTTKEVGKGTGLGLATVYGIMTQSSGYITVDSGLGHGATFSLYLPRVDAAPASTPAGQTPTALTGEPATILVVEDEADVRELVADILTATGYRVLSASNGADAFQLCAHHAGAIDLLLTDVVMPGMSGHELAVQIMQQWPRVKVLYMSGYTDEILGRYGIVDPSLAFLEKPFAPGSLTRKVREVLKKA
jgi:signal transduction histidine kinase